MDTLLQFERAAGTEGRHGTACREPIVDGLKLAVFPLHPCPGTGARLIDRAIRALEIGPPAESVARSSGICSLSCAKETGQIHRSRTGVQDARPRRHIYSRRPLALGLSPPLCTKAGELADVCGRLHDGAATTRRPRRCGTSTQRIRYCTQHLVFFVALERAAGTQGPHCCLPGA